MKDYRLSVLLTLLTACNASFSTHVKNDDSDDPEKKQLFKMTSDVETFSDCEEMKSYIRDREASYRDYYSSGSGGTVMSDSSAPAEASSGSSKSTGTATFTNVQEAGIDEGDRVKVADDFIYAVSPGFINVMKRSTLEMIHSIALSEGSNEYPILYAAGADLAVIEQVRDSTRLRLYKVEEDGEPTLSMEKSYKGHYRESRLNAGHVVLAVNDYIANRHYSAVDVSIAEDVKCSTVVKPFIDDMDWGLTKIFSIKLADPTIEHKTAFLGNMEHLYMSENSIYVTRSGSPWNPKGRYERSTIVARVAFAQDSGAVIPVSAGMVPGYVIGQWAFKELTDQGVLAIATTSDSPVDDQSGDTPTQNPDAPVQSTMRVGGSTNHLWILEESDEVLREVASIKNFAPREDIRAVRYVGTMAYVVTFEKTDPLFAFDLSDARTPKLLGELKIPGFSMYLHPISDTQLVGVGYEGDDQGDFSWFQGIQVSLFDVADATNMSRADVAILGKRGSYSDVTADHKAFMFDDKSGLVAFPVAIYQGDMTGGPEQATNLEFSGAIFYKPANGKLNEFARITHNDLIGNACQGVENYHWWQATRRSLDINRILSVDGKYLTFSRFGLKAFNGDMKQQTAVSFPAATLDCSTYGWAPYEGRGWAVG